MILIRLQFTAEDAWCTNEDDKDPYIQVDFLLKTRVTRVGTMRRKTKDHWVSEYFLQEWQLVSWQSTAMSQSHVIIHCKRRKITGYSRGFNGHQLKMLLIVKQNLFVSILKLRASRVNDVTYCKFRPHDAG